MITQLRQAQRFIMLEYFIIEEGLMWDTILEILEEKQGQGVEIRILYDDAGCFKTLPLGYDGLATGRIPLLCCKGMGFGI